MKADLGRAADVERNNFAAMRTIVGNLSSAWIRERHGIELFSTGIPFFLTNGMLGGSISATDAGPVVDDCMREMKGIGLPFCWMTGPSPSALAPLIESAGLRPIPMPGMWMALDRLAPPPAPPGVEVRELLDERELIPWAHALSRGFGLPLAISLPFADAVRSAGLGPQSPLRPFAAFEGEEMVATSLLVPETRTAGIYNVSTAEEARGRGIGAAVTHAALDAGRSAGLESATLLASQMGLRVYERLGFQTCCTFTVYAWSPDD